MKKNHPAAWAGLCAVFLLAAAGIAGGAAAAEAGAEAGADGINAEAAQARESRDVMYGIGSTSKVFTTAAVLRLADEGKVDLDAPLTTYLPEFKMEDSRYTAITPRMLLNHTSGLPGSSYRNSILLGGTNTYAHDNLLRQLSGRRLKADPGAFAVYCNDGFTLAELLVERVSGLGFTEYLERNFWDPLGLESTRTPQSLFDRERLAKTYSGGGNTELPPESVGMIGSGGIYSTAEELCRAAQIFMRDPGKGQGLLSGGAARAMEREEYASSLWPREEGGSSVAYGLGWDTVDAYPFGQYGIRALSKGGDTTAYHSNLTVLPEQNISCAVLSSGGSSSMAQLAVQEILLEYLKEIGEIEDGPKEPEYAADEKERQEIPEELLRYEGWYASRSIVHVEFADGGLLRIRSVGTDRDTTQEYAYVGDGAFESLAGNYISSGFTLIAGSNGTRGGTRITFREGDNGESYLMMRTCEYTPGLGSAVFSVPAAQKTEPAPLSGPVQAAWEKRAGKEYYLVSEQFNSTRYMTDPVLRPVQEEALPGYLDPGSDLLSVTRIQDTDHAVFFQQVPGQFGRDLKDIRFYRENGVEYLDAQDYLLVSQDAVTPLAAEDASIVTGADGTAQWYSTGKDWADHTVSIQVPEGGAYYVYHHETDRMTLTASSWGNGSNQIILPEDCRMVLVGEAGARFEIQVK